MMSEIGLPFTRGIIIQTVNPCGRSKGRRGNYPKCFLNIIMVHVGTISGAPIATAADQLQ